MKYSENAMNVLAALSYKGIGKAWIVQKLKGNKDVNAIVSLIGDKTKESITTESFEEKKEYFKTILTKNFSNFCDGFVAFGDDSFPKHGDNIKINDFERPVFLYYKGNLELLDIANKKISVIGLLNPSGDIEKRERKIVEAFVTEGATIISGLAFGCDEFAHRQALDSNGKTIAILPSPLNKILPAKHKDLADEIVAKGGLLVTEYGKDFKTPKELNSRYTERDRLQALFCDAIVLVASYAPNSAERWKIEEKKLDSGARLAMKYAKEYGIPRAVMYDENLDSKNPMFDLNRYLIDEDKGENNLSIINQDNLMERSVLIRLLAYDSKIKNFSNQSQFSFDTDNKKAWN